MENLYIDESGSMTSSYSAKHHYFVISIVRVLDKATLKKSIKRFVRSHWEELKLSDKNNKMFNGEKFLELKGSAMSISLKKDFVQYLAEKKSFEVLYILLDNRKVDTGLYKNTARAFNFMIKKAFTYFINKKYIAKKSDILIQIDERNERPEAKLHLQEYLNTELQLENKMTGEIQVEYFDSRNNSLIQLADFFANLMFSNLETNNYDAELNLLKERGFMKSVFKFPLKK